MPKFKRYFSPDYLFFPVFFVLQHYREHNVTFLWAEYAKFNKMQQRELRV